MIMVKKIAKIAFFSFRNYYLFFQFRTKKKTNYYFSILNVNFIYRYTMYIFKLCFCIHLYIVFILYLLIIADILVKLLFIIFFIIYFLPLFSHLLPSIYRLFNHKFCETILLIFPCFVA